MHCSYNITKVFIVIVCTNTVHFTVRPISSLSARNAIALNLTGAKRQKRFHSKNVFLTLVLIYVYSLSHRINSFKDAFLPYNCWSSISL